MSQSSRSKAQTGGIRKLYSPSLAASRTTSLSAKGSIHRAKTESNKELRRHLNLMLYQKQRLRRTHDDLGKAFSILSGATDLAVAVRKEVESAAAELLSGISESVPRALRQFDDINSSRNPINDLILHTAASHQQHAEVLRYHGQLLTAMVEEGQQVLSEIGVANREVLHMISLSDRAADVDMQCLGESIGSELLANGSPLFPGRTIDDADSVMQNCGGLCSKAERFATQLRRVASNGKCESMASLKQLSGALQTSARMAAEKIASTKREIEGMVWEEGRLAKQARDLDAEADELRDRLDVVKKTIRLRQAARETMFAKEYVDTVLLALQREEAELTASLEKVSVKRAAVAREVERIEAERRNIEHGILEAESHSKNWAVQQDTMRSFHNTPR